MWQWVENVNDIQSVLQFKTYEMNKFIFSKKNFLLDQKPSQSFPFSSFNFIMYPKKLWPK